ncbi:MAG: hypothetical protein M3P82_06595, partial [Bacteroidota bacterium]|nr:hypothetical protein [Bacteroidota bacterium]
ALYSISKPIVYFVNAVSYFGPAFVILFFYLKYFKNRIISLGMGVYISFIITIMLILNTESRMVINFYPFIILFTVLVLRDFNVGKKIILSVAVFSVILSKIYIPMVNVPGEESSYFTFHDQLYFMNTYLISYLSYYILSVVVLVISVYLMLAIQKNKTI